MRALTQRDRAHRAIAHALAALDAFVHIGGWRAEANLFERLNGANPNGRTRMVFRATIAVHADDRIRTNRLFLLRLTAEHLAPNTVTQANTSQQILISFLKSKAFVALQP